MDIQLKQLPPSEAWEDIERRSMAAAVAGFFAVATLQTAAPIPPPYRDSLATVSGMVSAFLIALILSVAYYHKRWSLGICGTTLAVMLPYTANILWIRLSGRSLIYPTIALVLLGIFCMHRIHRRLSGPRWVDNDDEEIRIMIGEMEDIDSSFTWMDRVTWLCFVGAVIVLLILLIR
jgi:hypothetical protein